MDTPLETSSSLPPSSDAELFQKNRVGRKRTRESLKADDSLDDPYDLNEDDRPKTRRVNPQRLAIRLGPDLVAEMEALIVPGAKMPTFAVRKDFQERYCVDRRHIYDYFHSRGLRVAKEDKHTNLIRGRALKAAAAAAAAAAEEAASFGASAKPMSITTLDSMALVGATAEVDASALPKLAKPKPKAHLKVLKKKTEKLKPRRIFIAPPPEDNLMDSSSSVLSETPSMESISSIAKDTWDTPTSLPELSMLDESSDISTAQEQSPDPSFFTSPDESFVYTSFGSALQTSPMLFPAEGTSFLDTENLLNPMELQYSSLDDYTLSQLERTDLYSLVQKSMQSNAAVTGESAGTYDAYMKEKSMVAQRYSSFSVSVPYIRQNKDIPVNPFHVEYSSALQYGLSAEPSPELPDIRSWLSEDLHYDDDSAAPGLQSVSAPAVARPVYNGRHENNRTSGDFLIKEQTRYTREKAFSTGQARPRTSSARGQISSSVM